MPIGIQEKQQRDSFDDFLDSLKEDREVIQEPVIPDPEPVEVAEELPGVDAPIADPVMERKKFEVSMIPAEVVVDVIDTAAVSLNSYIANEDQKGASESEKESMQHAFANYLKDTQIDLSPGKLCLVLVLMVYAPKTIQAFQKRKENQEKARLEARNAYLEQQLQLKEREAANGKVPGV